MNKDKILEKLRKLMNLKESALALGNEGEACAAAAGISRLLIAYNLSESDIPEQEKIDNPVIAEEIPFKPELGSGKWYELLVTVVCEYNMCRPLVISTRKGNDRMSKDKFQIVGRKKNVEVVLYLVSFLSNKFYQIGKKFYPEYKHNCMFKLGIAPKGIGMYLRSYLYGCVIGLNEKFESEKAELNKECDITSLVLSTKSEIDEFLKDEKILNARSSKVDIDKFCASQGYEEGRNVEINKGIYAETISEEKRLI